MIGPGNAPNNNLTKGAISVAKGQIRIERSLARLSGFW
jgi:hypothetical protein